MPRGDIGGPAGSLKAKLATAARCDVAPPPRDLREHLCAALAYLELGTQVLAACATPESERALHDLLLEERSMVYRMLLVDAVCARVALVLRCDWACDARATRRGALTNQRPATVAWTAPPGPELASEHSVWAPPVCLQIELGQTSTKQVLLALRGADGQARALSRR